AMPQLTRAAMIQGLLWSSLRWAYQAKVIKTLLQTSSPMEIRIGCMRALLVGKPVECISPEQPLKSKSRQNMLDSPPFGYGQIEWTDIKHENIAFYQSLAASAIPERRRSRRSLAHTHIPDSDHALYYSTGVPLFYFIRHIHFGFW